MSFLDKLPKLPFLTKNETPRENFFSLHIRFSEVTGAIWSMTGARVYVLNAASAPYENGNDFKTEASQQSLTDAANQSLDEALANITPEPTKLLFGVPDAWLEDENIKPEYLKLLKRLVKELDVTPMAYVSTTHAIAHILQKQSGIPVSGILIEVGDPVTVTVIKGGKTISWATMMVGKKMADSVEKALSGMGDIEVLPSRMLIYGSQDLDSVKDELAGHPWMQQLPFLHLPKVETLPDQIAIEAIAFAGASELNEVVNPEVINQAVIGDQKGKLSRKLPEEPFEVAQDEAAEFVEGDLAQMSEVGVRRSEKTRTEVRDNLEPPDVGEEDEEFMEQEDWVEEDAAKVPVRQRLGDEEFETYEKEKHHQQGENSIMGKLQSMILAPLTMLSGAGNEAKPPVYDSRLPAPSVPRTGGSPLSVFTNKLVIIPFLLIIVLGLIFYFVPHAKVSVFVDMKPLENSAQVIADPAATSVDVTNNIIPGKIVETDISGSGDGSATGTKQIGDPAKGAVVVYNKTDGPVTLSQGTELDGPNNLAFTLDSSVNVASQSAVEGGISFGKTTANATAKAIGPDGNIAAGTELSVKGKSSSDVSAKVDSAFSGGVSKTVTVVSADDVQKLLAQVTSDLRNKSKDDLQGKLTGDQKVLAESLVETVTKKSYSKNVGDQASKFTLTVNAHYKGTAYSDTDLKSIVSKLVQTKIPDPDHYTLDMSQTQTQASVSKVDKDGKLYFNAQFVAKLMPKFDENALKAKIAGKKPDEADQILKQNEDSIIGASFNINPPLPKQIQRLPFRKENITIEITAK